MFGYQGRRLNETVDKDSQRYYTIILNESYPKIFGLDTVDMDRKFYVFEGPIDSMFIPNSTAMLGGTLFGNDNAVIVYDNEPRNEEICKKIQKAINRGYKVCIWPENVVEKDVNELVMNGVPADFIKTMIDNNTWSSISAQLVFNNWRKKYG